MILAAPSIHQLDLLRYLLFLSSIHKVPSTTSDLLHLKSKIHLFLVNSFGLCMAALSCIESDADLPAVAAKQFSTGKPYKFTIHSTISDSNKCCFGWKYWKIYFLWFILLVLYWRYFENATECFWRFNRQLLEKTFLLKSDDMCIQIKPTLQRIHGVMQSKMSNTSIT